MLQRAFLAVLTVSMLFAASSAEAYVAVPNHQHVLERTAMLCPDMLPGRNVIETILTGRDIEAHVLSAPRILHETEQCIARAFERDGYTEGGAALRERVRADGREALRRD